MYGDKMDFMQGTETGTGRAFDTARPKTDITGTTVAKMTKDRIKEAYGILQDYKAAKAELEARVIQDEQYFRLHNWYTKGRKRPKTDTATSSAWLFNAVANKHADAMDNIPEPTVLPRAADDKATAEALTKVIPAVLEDCRYEENYDKAWTKKLVTGTAVKYIGWDADKQDGLGDITESVVDILNCYWQPGVENVQESRNFFYVTKRNIETLEEQYPELGGKLTADAFSQATYAESDHNKQTFKEAAVIDWYYKRGGILHLCTFVGDHVLYATEDDPEYAERGLYDHGMYPFIFDPLYRIEDSPAGFGLIDVCRGTQDYIDRLDSAIMKSALYNAHPKHFVSNQSGVNEDEWMDPEREIVHVNGDLQANIMPVAKSELNALYVQVLNNKVSELKETSGNNDVNNGGTAAGVTAYSAIAAMIEVGGKISRDMIKASYRKFQDEVYMIIELMRQFYETQRYFRIAGQSGEPEYTTFDNSGMQPQPMGNIMGVDLGSRLPVFDVCVKVSKQTAYSRMAQNELIKELYGMGMFNPQMSDQAMMVVTAMQFDGKDELIQKIEKNGTMYQQMQQMQAQMMQMAQVIDSQNGTNITAQLMGQAGAQIPGIGGAGNEQQMNVNSVGEETMSGKKIDKPQERVANATAPV